MLARQLGWGFTMRALPRWASRGFGTGVAVSLPAVVAVALVAAFPDLKVGYPLVLLPMLANGGLLALTFLVGWVGFSSLEEMHYQGHLLQLHARWQDQLSELEASLESEQIAHSLHRDETGAVSDVRRILAQLANSSPI